MSTPRTLSAGSPGATGRLSGDVDRGSSRVRFRRAVALLVMTLVAPGSAQLVAGNKRVGRAALRCWAGLVALLLLVALLGLTSSGTVISVFTDPTALLLVRLLLIGAAVGWAVLFLDAWRLGDPLRLAQRERLTVLGLNGLLSLTVSGVLLFASHVVAVQRDFITTVFGGEVTTSAHDGRYNVLLLGGDSGKTRVGLRPDSITLASVDQRTGRTVLFGLPRNLAHVPFPSGTVMHRHFPHGFRCDGCYLNAVYTWATDHSDLFKGRGDPGVTATEQAVEAVTGLKVNYYAMVNLRGFRDLVDAVGGVTLNVPSRIPIGSTERITGWIPAGRRHLDGLQTLWFARSRAVSDDYSRMARQKCVMGAMLQQLSPRTVVTKFESIADAGKALVTTDIPASQLDTFIELALKARHLPTATVSFVPPKVNTSDPDFAAIRADVRAAIARSAALDQPGTHPRTRTKAGTNGHRQHAHSRRRDRSAADAGLYAERQYAANGTSDLAATC